MKNLFSSKRKNMNDHTRTFKEQLLGHTACLCGREGSCAESMLEGLCRRARTFSTPVDNWRTYRPVCTRTATSSWTARLIVRQATLLNALPGIQVIDLHGITDLQGSRGREPCGSGVPLTETEESARGLREVLCFIDDQLLVLWECRSTLLISSHNDRDLRCCCCWFVGALRLI